jgi:pimeloyl-ACP methyl ester carboxylesterase
VRLALQQEGARDGQLKISGNLVLRRRSESRLAPLSEPSGTPAWKTIPSWAVIGTTDRVIPPALLQSMAQRAQAHITRVNAGHLSLISNPGVVTQVIIKAARATG